MTDRLYSFDTSTFIRNWRDLLPPAVFPGVWSRIADGVASGIVRAVDEVRVELSRRDDEVREWTEQQVGLFVPMEEDVQAATTQTLSACERLVGTARGRNQADAFVIGLALARSGIVVTQETFGKPTAPRIPDACGPVGVECIDLVQFLLREGHSF